MDDENTGKADRHPPTPITDDTGPRVADIYKMYSDRLTALRATMALIIPVAVAALKIFESSDIVKPYNIWIGGSTALFLLIIGLYLRVKANAVIGDYEKIIETAHRQAHRLLPLDSLMSAERYLGGAKEQSRFWTGTNLIAWFGALIIVVTVLLMLANVT